MAAGQLEDELLLRGLVALIEAQAHQLQTLRQAVTTLEGRLDLRHRVDVLLGHELRSPLTVVTGILQTLKDDMSDEPRSELVSKALTHANQLSEVLDEVLQAREATTPLLARVRLRVVPLGQLVDQAVAAVPG